MNDQGVTSRRWRTLRQFMPVGCCVLLLLLSACSPNTPSMLDVRGPNSRDIAGLSWLMFGIAAVVLTLVTVLLLLAATRARHEAAPTESSLPQDRQAVTLVVISGGVIPAVVLLGIMILAVRMDWINAEPAQSAVTVQVIGHRWWWEVRYPDLNVTTANEIHIPANQPVTMRVTSADVIHSFWVPQLDGKFDMLPGQTNTFTFEAGEPGSYRGECAEFCGTQHAHMAFMLVAEPEDHFETWLTHQQQPAHDPDANTEPVIFEGQQAFLGSSCVYCHTIAGTNASGTLGPDLTHLASRETIGAGVLPNNPGNLAGWIVNSQAIKPGNLMPPMDLDSNQLQAILAYLETLQ